MLQIQRIQQRQGASAEVQKSKRAEVRRAKEQKSEEQKVFLSLSVNCFILNF
jgi:hypothetical protein